MNDLTLPMGVNPKHIVHTLLAPLRLNFVKNANQNSSVIEKEALTQAQTELLNKCCHDWTLLPVGCTNKTLLVLEKKRLVETRVRTSPQPGLTRWEWRFIP